MEQKMKVKVNLIIKVQQMKNIILILKKINQINQINQMNYMMMLMVNLIIMKFNFKIQPVKIKMKK